MAFNLFGGGKGTTANRVGMQKPSQRPMPPMGGGGGNINVGPSPNFRGGWGRSSPGQDGTFGRMRPQVEPRQPGSMIMEPNVGPQPVSTTMPVGRRQPQFDFTQMPQPVQTPMEDSQLWRAYNRLSGGPMAPRMLF